MDKSRRSFLGGASGALVAFAALDWRQVAEAAAHAHDAAGSADPVLVNLSKTQAALLDAISSRIVPTDDLPGAHEAGVVYFIDHALGSFFAADREHFLASLAAFDRDCAAAHAGNSFAALPADAQDACLRTVQGTPFFTTLRQWTLFGLLTLPKYGGNRDLIGWKLVGLEDAHRFEPPFGYYDRDYPGFEPYPPEAGS